MSTALCKNPTRWNMLLSFPEPELMFPCNLGETIGTPTSFGAPMGTVHAHPLKPKIRSSHFTLQGRQENLKVSYTSTAATWSRRMQRPDLRSTYILTIFFGAPPILAG